MTHQRFRRRHPVFSGLLILAGIFLLFWGGIRVLVTSATRPEQSGIFSLRKGIGVIELTGVLVSSEEILHNLTEFRQDDDVKAIVLRIDSPGGAVGASQEVYTEVQRTNKVKPVVASLGSVAASGGYYAALGAERIIANPGTITGSIGVIIKFMNFSALFDKIGFRSEVVKSGKLKDMGAPDRPVTEEERALLQGLIDNVHSQFVEAVVVSRHLAEETVRAMADGRIFSGEQAREQGLIDDFGNFTDAVMLAASLGGLDTDHKMPRLIYPAQKDFPFLELLRSEGSDSLWNHFISRFPGLFYEWSLSG